MASPAVRRYATCKFKAALIHMGADTSKLCNVISTGTRASCDKLDKERSLSACLAGLRQDESDRIGFSVSSVSVD